MLKPITTLFITFCFAIICKGQISIGSNGMANSGDTFRFSNANALGTNLSQTGANTNWDFTNLVAVSQGKDEFRSFIQTPYFFYSQFLGAIGLKTADSINIGPISLRNIFTFYRKTSTRFSAEGTGFQVSGIPLASDYQDPDILYKYPMTYNQRDTDDFRVTTTLPTLGTLVQDGQRITVIDGWGTISTPFKTNANCLRYRSDITEIDSVKTSFASFGFPVNRREIQWWSNADKQPLVSVLGAVLAGTFAPAQVKYRDSFRNLRPVSLINASFVLNKTNGVANVDTFICNNNSIPNLPINTYNWSVSPNKVRFVNNTNAQSVRPQMVFTDSGNFQIKLIVSALNQSDDTALTVNISNTNSINLISDKLYIMPNPVGDHVTIALKNHQSAYLEIYNLQGSLLLHKIILDQEKVDLSFLSSGTYAVVLTQESAQNRFLIDKW